MALESRPWVPWPPLPAAPRRAMTRILEFLISVAIVLVILLGIGLVLPSTARVERSVELGNPISQVYDVLNGFKRWNTWQPWIALDPRAKYELEGEEFGVGARIKWNSMFEKQVGQGNLEIIESVPEEKIVMKLVNPWRGHEKTETFTLEQSSQTNAVTVRWAIDVDYGWDIIGRYAGLYLNGRVGELMNEGLGNLASLMATIPNVDYTQVEITPVDVPSADIAYVGIGVPAAPRQWDEAEAEMLKAWNEVSAYMSRNKLEAAGAQRRTINVLGEETNDFELGFPIMPPATPPALTGRVQLGKTYGGRAIMTEYRGHRVGLNKPRDMLKAYALTHGYNFDRDLTGMWEDWLPEPEDGSGTTTRLYLPIQ